MDNDEFTAEQVFVKLANEAYYDTPEREVYDLAGLATDSDADRIATGDITEAEAVLALLVWIAIDSESDSKDEDVARAIAGAAIYLDRRNIKWTSGR